MQVVSSVKRGDTNPDVYSRLQSRKTVRLLEYISASYETSQQILINTTPLDRAPRKKKLTFSPEAYIVAVGPEETMIGKWLISATRRPVTPYTIMVRV